MAQGAITDFLLWARSALCGNTWEWSVLFYLSFNLFLGLLTSHLIYQSVDWLICEPSFLPPFKLKSKPNQESGSLLEVQLRSLLIRYHLISVTCTFLPIEWRGWDPLFAVVKGILSLNTVPAFRSQLYHFLSLWPWATYLASPCLSFLTCDIWIIILPTSCLEGQMR